MVYILYGENDFLIKEELKKIKKELEPALFQANFISLEGGKLSPREFLEIINTPPFLAPYRLILVHNLLERFEEKEPIDPWLQIVRNKLPTSKLVLISGKLRPGNPALTALKPIARIKEFTPLRGSQLENWAKGRLSQIGSKITPKALRLLIQTVGEDQWKLSGEIEKLSLYSRGVIEEQDIVNLVSPAREISIFQLIDAWIEGKAQGEELHRLLIEGEKPSYIIALLTKQLGHIIRAKEMLSQGLSPGEIQKRLGLSDYPLEKTLKQCPKLTLHRLREIYSLLLETDLSIKTGRLPEEIALDIFQAQLRY